MHPVTQLAAIPSELGQLFLAINSFFSDSFPSFLPFRPPIPKGDDGSHKRTKSIDCVHSQASVKRSHFLSRSQIQISVGDNSHVYTLDNKTHFHLCSHQPKHTFFPHTYTHIMVRLHIGRNTKINFQSSHTHTHTG